MQNYLICKELRKSTVLSVVSILTICHLCFCRLQIFKDQLFRKIISEIPSDCQTGWTQIRPDFLSGLIWVQTVCIGYQQTTLVGKEFMLYHATPEITGEPAV